MKGQINDLQQNPWNSILSRVKQPVSHKRKFMASAMQVYNLVLPSCTYDEFCCQYIESTPLRQNVDYHYADDFKTIYLTVSSIQALLVQLDTESSWSLFNKMTDLINAGFSTI